MPDCLVQGTPVPAPLVGELTDSTALLENSDVDNGDVDNSNIDHRDTLRKRIEQDGYLFLRGAVDCQRVEAARSEVFTRLAEVGEIQTPAIAGIATGTSRRREQAGDLGLFWRSVSQGAALRAATHGSELHEIMTAVLGQPAQPHDYLFLRPARVGLSTRLHFDFPFFARHSPQIYTVWLALGEIPHEDGTLMVVEGSNRFVDLIDAVKQIDYDSQESPTVQVMENTVDFVQSRDSRLLTTHFKPGDVVIFDMFTMHGTFDNHSPQGRVRLSCDVRWQPASDPLDPRYAGSDPPGTTGIGYGELNGAKPLTEDWHTR